jgi:hypothetical protein
MRISEILKENKTPGEYVYHASFLPDQRKGLYSILKKGLLPSKHGYNGPGVYFAYEPDGGYYHVDPDQATLFRVKWQDLVNRFGVLPQNPNGIQLDNDEIIVPGPVPADILEVEYYEDEWWDLDSAYSASRGPSDY